MCEDTASQPVKRRYWQVASEVVACGGRAIVPPVCESKKNGDRFVCSERRDDDDDERQRGEAIFFRF